MIYFLKVFLLGIRYKILVGYIFTHIISLYLAIFGVLSLVIVGNQAIRFLIKGQEIGVDNIGLFIGFNALKFLPILLSLSLFLSIIIALGRLYKNSEMVAMQSVGLNTKYLLLSVQLIVIPIMIIVGSIQLYINPWAVLETKTIQKTADNMAGLTRINANKFYHFLNNSITLYAQKADLSGKNLESVFLKLNQAKKESIVVAKYGIIDKDFQAGRTTLILKDGTLYHGLLSDKNHNITTFKQYDILLKNKPKQTMTDLIDTIQRNQVETQTLSQLLHQTSKTQAIELHRRLSHPISVLLLCLLAVMLAKTSHRSGGLMNKILLGVFIFILYHNLLSIVKKAMLDGGMHLWWVHTMMVILIYWLYYKQQNNIAKH